MNERYCASDEDPAGPDANGEAKIPPGALIRQRLAVRRHGRLGRARRLAVRRHGCLGRAQRLRREDGNAAEGETEKQGVERECVCDEEKDKQPKLQGHREGKTDA